MCDTSETRLLMTMFAPHEVEALVCGVQQLDWNEFEHTVSYQGYTRTSETIESVSLLTYYCYKCDDMQALLASRSCNGRRG